MRNRSLMSLVALLLGFTLVAAACSSDDDSEDTTTTTEAAEETTTTEAESDDAADGDTIVDIAASDEQFSTLVTAVTEAGLVETLSGDGPFTVFAPTNDAFDALPEGTLETLLEDPEGDLAEILQLHVIAGEVDSSAALEAVDTCVETLGGQVKVAMDGDDLTVGGAVVSATDIEASNGIIHVIDSVIVEPSTDC